MVVGEMDCPVSLGAEFDHAVSFHVDKLFGLGRF